MEHKHINCKDTKCQICFDDATNLETFLTEKTGNDKVDHMGKYHKWLTDNGITAETEYGWPSEETYSDDNIERYVRWFITNVEEICLKCGSSLTIVPLHSDDGSKGEIYWCEDCNIHYRKWRK